MFSQPPPSPRALEKCREQRGLHRCFVRGEAAMCLPHARPSAKCRLKPSNFANCDHSCKLLVLQEICTNEEHLKIQQGRVGLRW